MNTTVKKVIEKNIISKIMPHKIQPNKVLFESNGPYDNAYSIFLYVMKNRKDIDAYFFAPYSSRTCFPEAYKERLIFYGSDCSFRERLKYFKHIYTFSYVFSSYGLYGSDYSNSKRVFLCHGIGLKAAKNYVVETIANFDRVLLPTSFVARAFEERFEISNSIIDVSPSPRKSLLSVTKEQKDIFGDLINAHNDENIILVMTTIRRLDDGNIDVNRILTIDIDFNRLNDILHSNNQIMVIKLHHAFDIICTDVFPILSNIVFLKNSDILKIGLNPTSIMTIADAFISDYSSATTDYLFMNRPVGYLIPDFEKYKDEVGGDFLFDNVKDLMPGYLFFDQNGLEDFINVAFKNDFYKEKREQVSELLNGHYPDNFIPEKAIVDLYL